MDKNIINELKSICSPENVKENEPMKKHVSFKAGGNADCLVIPDDRQQLVQVINLLRDSGEDFLLMGNGSNLLITDGGYKGVIIKIEGPGFSDISVEGTVVKAGAGALLSQVAKAAAKESLTGFEFASGIPGSVGGGLFMNAGAYGGEMKDIVQSAEVLDTDTGEVITVPVSEMDLGYRRSAFMKGDRIVLKVTYELEHGDQAEIESTMKDLMERRNSKQPVNFPSAGSFFKRPEGYFAGKLIQDAGLKGLQCGGAQVSELHAGFVINRGDATASDIIELMHIVQNVVYDKFGVALEPEVRIIGEPEDE